MRLLGAILAGGQSRRFGSNKALALLDGQPLIAHAITALRPQVDALVTCGMAFADLPLLVDRPAPDLGPLGGIAAALAYAAANGFDAVVSTGCDMPRLPANLVAQLCRPGGATYASRYPMIGLWPASLSATLDTHLSSSVDRSMKRWAALIDARAIDLPPLANVNSPADLAALSASD